MPTAQYLKLAEKMQATIKDAVKEDPNRLYAFDDFERNLRHSVDIGSTNIIGIEELMKARTESLLKHPLFNGKNPIVSNVNHTVANGKTSITAKVSDGQKVWLMYRQGPAEPFKQLEMAMSGNGTYSISLDKATKLQYYIIAEGERLAVCSPERASYVFYEISRSQYG